MRTLHICSSKNTNPLIRAFEDNKLQASDQLILCPNGSETETWCLDNELVTFPFDVSVLQGLNNALLIKSICRNYDVERIHLYDEKAKNVMKTASRLFKSLRSLPVSEIS